MLILYCYLLQIPVTISTQTDLLFANLFLKLIDLVGLEGEQNLF